MTYSITKEIFEILEEFGQQTTKTKRKEVLLKYENGAALKVAFR